MNGDPVIPFWDNYIECLNQEITEIQVIVDHHEATGKKHSVEHEIALNSLRKRRDSLESGLRETVHAFRLLQSELAVIKHERDELSAQVKSLTSTADSRNQ